MSDVNLPEWNRKLVEETIAVLESSQETTADALSRLRGFLAVNPGGPTIGPLSEMDGHRSVATAT
jgi:hypothetical protein